MLFSNQAVHYFTSNLHQVLHTNRFLSRRSNNLTTLTINPPSLILSNNPISRSTHPFRYSKQLMHANALMFHRPTLRTFSLQPKFLRNLQSRLRQYHIRHLLNITITFLHISSHLSRHLQISLRNTTFHSTTNRRLSQNTKSRPSISNPSLILLPLILHTRRRINHPTNRILTVSNNTTKRSSSRLQPITSILHVRCVNIHRPIHRPHIQPSLLHHHNHPNQHLYRNYKINIPLQLLLLKRHKHQQSKLTLRSKCNNLINRLIPIQNTSAIIRVRRQLLLRSQFRRSTTRSTTNRTLNSNSTILFTPILMFIPMSTTLNRRFTITRNLNKRKLTRILTITSNNSLRTRIIMLRIFRTRHIRRSLLIPVPKRSRRIMPIVLRRRRTKTQLILSHILRRTNLRRIKIRPSHHKHNNNRTNTPSRERLPTHHQVHRTMLTQHNRNIPPIKVTIIPLFSTHRRHIRQTLPIHQSSNRKFNNTNRITNSYIPIRSNITKVMSRTRQILTNHPYDTNHPCHITKQNPRNRQP